MKLTLNRFEQDSDSTLGRLLVPTLTGDNWTLSLPKQYFTVEDEFRTVKVAGETRIDPGEYRIRLRREGGMVKRYDKRFSPFHDGMLWLQDVPGFKWVYIHAGNSDDDTEGCILVGMQRGAGLTILKSAVAYAEIYKAVWSYAEADDLSIVIRDQFKEAA